MKKALFAFTAAMLVSGAAMAQGYVGITGGITKQHVDCSGTTSCDTSDTGYKFYGGYKFTPMFALEASYTDFGQVSARVGAASGSYSATSFSVGGAVFFPLAPKLTGVARLGISSSDAEASLSLGSFSAADSESHTNPYFGFGLGYALTPKLSLNGSFDYARIKYNGDSSATTLLGIGLSYAF